MYILLEKYSVNRFNRSLITSIQTGRQTEFRSIKVISSINYEPTNFFYATPVPMYIQENLENHS